MKLEPLTREDMEQIRVWRHEVAETLRTPFLLTREMQEDYYEKVICDRKSTTRYWALINPGPYVKTLWDGTEVYDPEPMRQLVGYGGIENISWENHTGEISVLIAPDKRGQGLGKEAVRMFLDQAFNYLNLEYVHGECYTCGPWEFWDKLVKEYMGDAVVFGTRKYWRGSYFRSYQFEFNKEDFNEC